MTKPGNPANQDRQATPGDAPAPLGEHPSSEKIIDTAVEATFPASDATAVGAGVHAAEEEVEEQKRQHGRDAEDAGSAGSRPPLPPGEFVFPRSPS